MTRLLFISAGDILRNNQHSQTIESASQVASERSGT